MKASKIQKLRVALLAAIILVCGQAATAGDLGRCYRADIPAPMVLPDGSEHDPGTLRICMARQLSPVQAIHETSVDGQPIGMFISRLSSETATPGDDHSQFVFLRDAAGKLVLQGYKVPRGGAVRIHYQTAPTAVAEAKADAEEIVLIAAR